MDQIVKVLTALVQGIEGRLFEIEISVDDRDAGLEIIGIPEAAARELRVRVVSALRQLDHRVSDQRVVVRMATETSACSVFSHLPVAAGILAALRKLPFDALLGRVLIGELSLDGLVRPVPGILPMVLAARNRGVQEVIVPAANEGEATLVPGIRCVAVESLADVVGHLTGTCVLLPVRQAREIAATAAIDLADVNGHAHVKRALEVAAAGDHHLLMIGPPGSGKTMMARRLTTILPPMTECEMLEVTAIHSVAGLVRFRSGMISHRPFRAPHHTASVAALAGGGSMPRPGEISLAHHGVLFLDELTEWRRNCLEAVRQTVEARESQACHDGRTVTFPADCLVVAAMTGCPCGYIGEPGNHCSCSSDGVATHRKRVEAMTNWCDIHVEIQAVPVRDLVGPRGGETSEAVRTRVVRALEFRRSRGSAVSASADPVSSVPILPPEALRLLEAARERLGLPAKVADTVVHVARTIADLDASEGIRAVHVSEAIQYRLLDRTA